MAILHRATVRPTKPELVLSWLDRQPWGGAGEIDVIGSYRFDDPDGEVGVEAILIRRAASVLHVPMTYRGAPLVDARAQLIGTMHHSVLGKRWIYEATSDPVAVGCFTRALSGHQEQATLDLYEGGELVARREPVVRVRCQPGSAPTPGDLRLATVLGEPLDGREQLVATWPGGEAVVAAR
ncbi:MAG: maltokinase N-terminal cap-like domain-containing protein [Micromonosporaceae bacterium]